jgi:hypothetical protein
MSNQDTTTFLHLFPAYNEKVVSFLRQPNATDILKEKYPTYATTSKLRDKVNKIQTGGTESLERMCNDLDLILLLRYMSMFSRVY